MSSKNATADAAGANTAMAMTATNNTVTTSSTSTASSISDNNISDNNSPENHSNSDTNIHLMSYDKTNYAQGLMHMIKGNLGTGILAMPSTFALCSLLYGCIGLPLLCLVATCCVHLLVKSSQHLENKIKLNDVEYAVLAKGSFKAGPRWLRSQSRFMCNLVDGILILSQMGICCVYIVFVVENIKEIVLSRSITYLANEGLLYCLALATILPLSWIRTLRSLSFVSGAANILQVIGITITVYLLVLPINNHPDEHKNHNQTASHTHHMPANTTFALPIITEQHEHQFASLARGFGAAMFAFEGISVVLPIYSRMKRPQQVGGPLGIVNVSYSILLVLYMLVGITGYLCYGDDAKGSISQNLERGDLLPDIVRGLFVISLVFTYPLQFYVPNEIIWNWARNKFLSNDDLRLSIKEAPKQNVKFEYICRTILVLITFFLAISINKLRLLMELVGAISGTALSIILPAIIHLATFWEETTGASKILMLMMDCFIIVLGVIASASGSFFSAKEIIEKWHEP